MVVSRITPISIFIPTDHLKCHMYAGVDWAMKFSVEISQTSPFPGSRGPISLKIGPNRPKNLKNSTSPCGKHHIVHMASPPMISP